MDIEPDDIEVSDTVTIVWEIVYRPRVTEKLWMRSAKRKNILVINQRN